MTRMLNPHAARHNPGRPGPASVAAVTPIPPEDPAGPDIDTSVLAVLAGVARKP
jgi:hypothetical protein